MLWTVANYLISKIFNFSLAFTCSFFTVLLCKFQCRRYKLSAEVREAAEKVLKRFQSIRSTATKEEVSRNVNWTIPLILEYILGVGSDLYCSSISICPSICSYFSILLLIAIILFSIVWQTSSVCPTN